MASNNPDINNTYTLENEYFYTQNEVFLLDATPQTPNNFEDAALLAGVTYSNHAADIHITPTGYGGKNFDLLKSEIDKGSWSMAFE